MISVIIPALNEAAYVARAVQSAVTSHADEVWVVDGGSEDSTVEQARLAGAQVIASPPGRAVQMNQGARLARGEVLVFLHADCFLAPTALRQLRKVVDQPWLFGAFRQRIDEPSSVYRIWEWGNALRVRWFGVAYGDQAIFVRRRTFEKIGGFPQEPLLEDLLLSVALRRQCWPILLDGPVGVSARRWKRYGLVRQTIRNWAIVAAWCLGVSPTRLACYYQGHRVLCPRPSNDVRSMRLSRSSSPMLGKGYRSSADT